MLGKEIKWQPEKEVPDRGHFEHARYVWCLHGGESRSQWLACWREGRICWCSSRSGRQSRTVCIHAPQTKWLFWQFVLLTSEREMKEHLNVTNPRALCLPSFWFCTCSSSGSRASSWRQQPGTSSGVTPPSCCHWKISDLITNNFKFGLNCFMTSKQGLVLTGCVILALASRGLSTAARFTEIKSSQSEPSYVAFCYAIMKHTAEKLWMVRRSGLPRACPAAPWHSAAPTSCTEPRCWTQPCCLGPETASRSDHWTS